MSNKPYVISQDFELTFTQDTDCCSSEDQFITIKTQNGGGGDYFVVNTDRWAFDCIEDLVRILYEFKKNGQNVYSKFTCSISPAGVKRVR